MYKQIKELCKSRKISVNHLEKELGFAKGYLSKIDKNTPSYKRIKTIADYFGVPVEYIEGASATISDRAIEEDCIILQKKISTFL